MVLEEIVVLLDMNLTMVSLLFATGVLLLGQQLHIIIFTSVLMMEVAMFMLDRVILLDLE